MSCQHYTPYRDILRVGDHMVYKCRGCGKLITIKVESE